MKPWQIMASAAALAATFAAGWQIANWQNDSHALTAEQRIEQRQAADAASAESKREGERHVEEVRDAARRGRRDHFADGWMRDD